MRHLSNKIAAAKASVIAKYKMGDDCFSIFERNGMLSGNFNGYDVLAFEDAFKNRAANVFGSLIAFLSDKNESKISFIKSKNANILVQNVNQYLKNCSKKIVGEEGVLKIETPDFDVGEALNQKALLEYLRVFQGMLRNVANLLSDVREHANVLSGGRIVSTMWGAQQMQQILNHIKKDIEDDSIWGKLDFFIEMIDRSLERLIIKLNTDVCRVCSEEKKIVGTVLIPNVISNYEILVSRIAKILVVLEPLINIDSVFKKETSYPASWFLKGNMLNELKEDFGKMIKIVIRTPEIEKQALFPLDVLKTQFMTEK